MPEQPEQPDLADAFQPDYTPEQLENLGVYDSLYRGQGPRLASLGEWKPEWVSEHDPKGWAQWYKRYSAGRRISDEDERQMKRWLSFKARHGGPFSKNPTPRRGWALRNWGIDPAKLVPNEARNGVVEMLEQYKNKKMQQYVKEKVAEETAAGGFTPPQSASAPSTFTKSPKLPTIKPAVNRPVAPPTPITQPSLVGKAMGYKPTATLGSQIGRWYQNAGGLNKAITGAQQAQQNRDPAVLNANTWPQWKPEDVTRRSVPIATRDLSSINALGFYSPKTQTVSMHNAVTPADYQPTLEHELSHAVYIPNNAASTRQRISSGEIPAPDDSATQPDANWQMPALAATKRVGPNVREKIRDPDTVEQNKYVLDPAEVDVRLAEIKRRYAHHTGQLVNTPEDAEKAWNWWRENQKTLPLEEGWPTTEKSEFKTYDELPDAQKQQLFYRMPELVRNNMSAYKFGASVKQADLLPEVNLQPHQERIQDTVDDENPRMIVYHGLGSGKSLSAIAAAEAAKKKYNEDYGIVAPASLRGNFQKEVEKFTENSDPEILSYTGLGLGKKFKQPPATLIMDEAHRLRNPGGAAAQAAADAANQAKRVLLLTGSPITNSPSDLANLISIVARKNISPQDFEKKYIGYKTVYPGLFNWARGITPGIKPVVRNEAELKNLLQGHVDYQPSKTPEGVNVNEEKIQVPLTSAQQKIQKALRTKIPPGFLWKLDQEFPLGKDELSKLNSFLTGLRQNSVSTRPFRVDNDAFKAFQQSGKLQEAYGRLKELLDSDPRKKAIIYSNHIGAGVEPYAAALAKYNVPHGIFHGGVPTKQRQKALADYNAGKLRALLIGPAGAEGLSTKGTNLIQLLDPHWHESRSQQAQGRGLRFDSHDDLPEELKNVHVQRFISKSEEPSFLGKLLGYRRERTGDEILERLSNEKEKINERFRQLLREVGTRNDQKSAAYTFGQKTAGFRWYKRFPMTENLALNLSLAGPSLTVKKLLPGASMTFGNRAPRLYVGTPIPGVAYQQYISHKKRKIKAEKEFKDDPENPKTQDSRSSFEKIKDFLFGSEYGPDDE
jgi:hypothetical protein